jgi:hypothetical protein
MFNTTFNNVSDMMYNTVSIIGVEHHFQQYAM